MKILNGGKKDYYDYLAGVYGIDEDIVYDRRDGHVFRINDDGEQYFVKTKLWGDRIKGEVRRGRFVGNKYTFETELEGLIMHIVIEVGYNQYLFEIERYLDEFGKIHIEPKLLKKETIKEKKCKEPVALIPVEYQGWFRESPKITGYDMKRMIKNPIFSGTWLSSFISPEEMYNEVYNYLISIREPKIEDNRNDVQKLESKGFDKKTSFRNPINKRRK